MKTKQDFISKIHLIISVFVVFPVAISYGFFPDLEFELFPKTIDEHNFYKAIMGLYIACAFIWMLGIFKTNYLKTALITNVVFMLGLGFGRITSMLVDGLPTQGYVIGTFLELFLGCYGIWVLVTQHQRTANTKTD
ncbi:DUF4345 domain-containing protein [Winogradskyella jejuensis]|uniref:DUF4345 domain-containing protein n=1 Tax=Winogradskyella jejuensis TaxID=1089305 RepID=A0A1M5N284_9FLAO|nr:DUF4345 domain-containing protein [Winogradskyella jejuensis]SHG83680.1 protein of unknown function [Winogradskyella jejuensis]